MSTKSINLFQTFLSEKAKRIQAMPLKCDTIEVLCDLCCEPVFEISRFEPADHLEGHKLTCPCCGISGHLTLCDDEGRCWLEFRSDDEEISIGV